MTSPVLAPIRVQFPARRPGRPTRIFLGIHRRAASDKRNDRRLGRAGKAIFCSFSNGGCSRLHRKQQMDDTIRRDTRPADACRLRIEMQRSERTARGSCEESRWERGNKKEKGRLGRRSINWPTDRQRSSVRTRVRTRASRSVD